MQTFLIFSLKGGTMSKTITEQIHDLEQENLRLKSYEKLFEKALKNEFNATKKTIQNSLNFQQEIMHFFNLKNDHDLKNFLDFFCTENYLSEYKKTPLNNVQINRDNESNYYQ